MQSVENIIATDLIATALRLALQDLEESRPRGLTGGPYSTIGMLERALEARAKEIRARVEVDLEGQRVERESRLMTGTRAGGPPSS